MEIGYSCTTKGLSANNHHCPHCQYMHLTLIFLPSKDVLLTQSFQSDLDLYTLRSSYDLREGLTSIFQNKRVPPPSSWSIPNKTHASDSPSLKAPSWQAYWFWKWRGSRNQIKLERWDQNKPQRTFAHPGSFLSSTYGSSEGSYVSQYLRGFLMHT